MDLVSVMLVVVGWIAGVLTVIGAEMVGLYLSQRRRAYRRDERWD